MVYDPGQSVEIIVEEREISLAAAVLTTYQIKDGDVFTVQEDKNASQEDKNASQDDKHIITPSGKVLLRDIARFVDTFREGDIVHIYEFSPSSVKYQKGK